MSKNLNRRYLLYDSKQTLNYPKTLEEPCSTV